MGITELVPARLAIPKTSPRGKKHPDRLTPQQFRDAVWTREQGRSRASGMVLVRGEAPFACQGSVCHLRARRVAPERATDPANAVLMSEYEHWLSDGRGGNLLKLLDPETREKATDASQPILFEMYDRAGKLLWSVLSAVR